MPMHCRTNGDLFRGKTTLTSTKTLFEGDFVLVTQACMTVITHTFQRHSQEFQLLKAVTLGYGLHDLSSLLTPLAPWLTFTVDQMDFVAHSKDPIEVSSRRLRSI